MVIGVVLFAIVAHFVLVPKADPAGGLALLVPALLGVALAMCAVAILLSTRVPRQSGGEALEAYWRRNAPRAMIPWALLEGAALFSVVVYSQTASRAAIAIALVAVIIFGLMNPGYFERR